MMMTKEMMSSAQELERRQRKTANTKKTAVKRIQELEWKPEDCAQPIGNLIKFTGEGAKKKCHYGKFEFHGVKYGLEDAVILVPEDSYQKPYVAIIKDIYIQGKEGYVKLDVQWFYRPEDVDQKCVRNWKSKDSRDLFYSFHRDEVFAESVKYRCLVYFVSENKLILNHRENPDFIVQKVYNTAKKKLWNLTHNDFNQQQKHEIGLLLEKTASSRVDLLDRTASSRVVVLPHIEKSMYYRSVAERLFEKLERTSHESINVVNAGDCKSILKEFVTLTGDSDRDKGLYELLEAVKGKQDCFDDPLWPGRITSMVVSLEQTLYDSLAKDKPKYNHKLEMLVDKLKDSPMLAECFLNGELKAEQILTMTSYELTGCNDHNFDEIAAVFKEPTSQIDVPSTSKSVRH